MRTRLLVTAIGMAACGGPSRPPESSTVAPASAIAATTVAQDVEAEGEPHFGLAATPLTPFADAMVTVALAAIRGTPMPARVGDIPVYDVGAARPCARTDSERPPPPPMPCAAPDELEVHSVQIDFGFHVRAHAAGEPNVIAGGLLLDASGLAPMFLVAIAETQPRFDEVPAWLAGAEVAGAMRVAVADRALLALERAPAPLHDQLTRARSQSGWEVLETLAAIDDVVAYTGDDLYV